MSRRRAGKSSATGIGLIIKDWDQTEVQRGAGERACPCPRPGSGRRRPRRSGSVGILQFVEEGGWGACLSVMRRGQRLRSSCKTRRTLFGSMVSGLRVALRLADSNLVHQIHKRCECGQPVVFIKGPQFSPPQRRRLDCFLGGIGTTKCSKSHEVVSLPDFTRSSRSGRSGQSVGFSAENGRADVELSFGETTKLGMNGSKVG